MARRIEFFDGAESSTVPTIGNIDTTSLIAYADDATYEAANAGSPLAGNIYFNTTLNVVRYYDGTSWVNVPKTAETLSYDNATSGLTATNVQDAIDETEARVDTAESNITSAQTDISNLETLSGEGGATSHSAFTGTTIPDSSTTHQALQALETAVESKIDSSEKGAANGVATLDGSGLIPASQLPSYVDDVLEYADFASLPVTGETAKIYVTLDNNKTYRWTGSIYIEVSPSEVTSVNSQAGAVVLNLDDINDVNITSVAARNQIRRNSGNTEWENFDPNSVANDATTGSNVTLNSISTSIVRLTNASLVSIDMIPASTYGQTFILVNRTGVSLTVNHDTGATAANRIYTGTNLPLTLGIDAALVLVYDATTQRWQVVGGSGAGGVERFPALDNAEWLTGRNTGDTADINIARINASNQIELSSGTTVKMTGHFEPPTDGVYRSASSALRWLSCHADTFEGPGLSITLQTTPSGATGVASLGSSSVIDAALFSGNNTNADAVATRRVLIESGNKTSASATGNTGDVQLKTGNAAGTGGGNSGNIILETGTSAGGSRGTINFKGPSLSGASVGYVWTLQNTTTGAGSWTTAPSAGNLNVVSYSSATTASVTDDIIQLSGASFTLGLPTAVGASGKVYEIVHLGTSLTDTYTINPNGAETIRGQSDFKLHTNGQRVKIYSDGSNWQVTDHFTETAWTSYTPTFTGFGTATNISFWWKRRGDTLLIQGRFSSGASTATEARVSLPGSVTVHSTILPAIRPVGQWSRSNNASLFPTILAEPSVSYVTFSKLDGSTSNFTKLNGNATIASTENCGLHNIQIPITDWEY